MTFLDRIAESTISEAVQRGELDDLPGAGVPLVLDDDSLVPEELRAGYRLLRNAGYIPPEVADRRDIADVEDLLASLEPDDIEARRRARQRLGVLMARLDGSRGAGRTPLWAKERYEEKLLTRLDRNDEGGER